jgi:hypothetical protein
MSNPHHSGDSHGHGDDHGASDEIAYGKVIGVGVTSLVIFALCTVWAAVILKRETARVESSTGAAKPVLMKGRSEIGIVDQVPFIVDHRLEEWRAEHKAKLDGYGWVDRSKGIAHIPIEQAMDQVAAGALPQGAPR